MFDFTLIEKRDTDLGEYLWDNDMRDKAGKVSNIEDYNEELKCAFEEAVDDSLYTQDEINDEDIFDYVTSNDFDELLDKTHEVAEKLYTLDDGDKYAEFIEFLIGFDPFDDAGVGYGEDKIDFYIDTLEMILNSPTELVEQLQTMREDIEDDADEAEMIDDYIEMLKGEE